MGVCRRRRTAWSVGAARRKGPAADIRQPHRHRGHRLRRLRAAASRGAGCAGAHGDGFCVSWLAYDTDGWIDLAAAKAKGAQGVGLYLGFNLLTAQAQTAATLGIGLWSFWEGQASNPDGGASQGTVDGTTVCSLADQAGQPNAAPSFMPNDQVVTNESATLAYFQAAAEEIRKQNRTPGFYGQTSVWQSVKGYGYTYFVKAPDGTQDRTDANIVQSVLPHQTVGGVTVDVDSILTADFGGWNANGLYQIGDPSPLPIPGGKTDMGVIVKLEGTQGPWYNVDQDKLTKSAPLSTIQLNACAAMGFAEKNLTQAQLNALTTV